MRLISEQKLIFYSCLTVFMNPEMEPVHPIATLRGKGDHDGVDVTSWVSVCPGGLWKVQKNQTYDESHWAVSNSRDVTGKIVFLLMS